MIRSAQIPRIARPPPPFQLLGSGVQGFLQTSSCSPLDHIVFMFHCLLVVVDTLSVNRRRRPPLMAAIDRWMLSPWSRRRRIKSMTRRCCDHNTGGLWCLFPQSPTKIPPVVVDGDDRRDEGRRCSGWQMYGSREALA